MKRKLLAVILVLAMSLSVIGGKNIQVFAKTALTEDNMADTVLLIKNRLSIGEEYSNFDYDFYETTRGVTWNFFWSVENGEKSIYVTCDGQGHITGYSSYDDSGRGDVPVYTINELLETAVEQIAVIAPEIAGSVKFKKASSNIWGNTYSYNFVREENGIEMPDNYVNVRINFVTGKFSSYSASWLYDVTIPSAEGIMTREEASKIIDENVNLQLSYYIGYDEDGNEKAFLAYVPDTEYIAVNAKTGKVYTTKSYWSNSFDDAEMEESNTADSGVVDKNSASLSEAELAKIEELKNIITSEEAIELIKNNDYLLVDKNCNYTEAILFKSADGKYFWRVYLRDNTPYDWSSKYNYRPYAYATVDAQDGTIMSFNASVKSLYEISEDEIMVTKVNYTKTQCRKILESFIKSVNEERFNSTVLASAEKGRPIAYDELLDRYTYGGFDFLYNRYYRDIPVNRNYISGQVDAVSGKVYYYSCNWSEAELPSPEGIINEAEAFEDYLAYPGYDLVYEVVNKYVNDDLYGTVLKSSARLVYRTSIYPAFVDAYTGKQLDYNGSEHVEKVISYSYNDIENSKYKHDIELLAGLGVGFDSDTFEPEKVITEKEFTELMNSLSYYTGRTDEEASNKKLTRQEMAKILITSAGYDELAQLDIYTTGYSDEAKIAKGYKGYVALAKGLGLMKAASGKKFKPGSGVTRGEAAHLLVNALSFR